MVYRGGKDVIFSKKKVLEAIFFQKKNRFGGEQRTKVLGCKFVIFFGKNCFSGWQGWNNFFPKKVQILDGKRIRLFFGEREQTKVLRCKFIILVILKLMDPETMCFVSGHE